MSDIAIMPTQKDRLPTFQNNPKIKLLTVVILFALTLLLNPIAAWAQSVPKLPKQWGDSKSGKFTLIDFYASYCGTCKMMEPYLQRLQVTNGKQLTIKHINAEKRDTWASFFKYPIMGTPTYFLFNAVGEPIYKMERWISPLILQTQVRRAVHGLKSVQVANSNLPQPLENKPDSWGNMILLAFEHKTGCDNCVSHQAELLSFENVGQTSGLKVVYLDTGKLPSWAEPLRPKTLPTYMLLDNRSSDVKGTAQKEYGILLNVNGDIDMQTLWQNIALFSDNGIKP